MVYLKEKKVQEEEEKKQKVKDLTKLFEKEIYDLIDKAELSSQTRWKDIKPVFQELDTYKQIKDCDGSCHDIYDDVLHKYRKLLHDPLDILSKFIKEKSIKFTDDLNYDEISRLINESGEEGETICEMNKKDNTMLKRAFNELLYIVLLLYLKYKEEKYKDKKKFFSLLKEYYYKEKHIGTTYDQAKERLSGKSAWERIMNTEERKEYFEEYMDKLRYKIRNKDHKSESKNHEIKPIEIEGINYILL